MTVNKNEFELGIEELHASAESITKGLESIVSAIDTVARDNSAFIKNPDMLPTGEHGNSIRAMLHNIRSQISTIADAGRQFETQLADHAVEVVELGQQLEQTKKVAMLDSITGIGNRRHFEDALSTILENIQDFENQVSVLLADVDNFKTINDTLGHHVGDQVLRLVAQNFAKNLKGTDVVARWGGDEFAAILPATALRNAGQVAENVRSSISHQAIRNKETGEEMGRVTLSIGVSSYRAGDNPHKMIFRADQALYEAKRGGRDRIETEGDD